MSVEASNFVAIMKQALEALDAGPNAYLLMNTGGIANKLRQAIAEAEPSRSDIKQVSYTGNGTAGRENMTAPTGFFFQMPKAEKQEPVAWLAIGGFATCSKREADGWVKAGGSATPLYTHPYVPTERQPKRAVSETHKPLTDEQKSILNFLLGANDFDGVWYGERHPQKKGAFWWRDELRKAFQESAHGINAPLKEKNT